MEEEVVVWEEGRAGEVKGLCPLNEGDEQLTG